MVVDRRAQLAEDRPLLGQVMAALLHEPGHGVHAFAEQPNALPDLAGHGAQGLFQVRPGLATCRLQPFELVAELGELRPDLSKRAGQLPLLAQLIFDRAGQQRLHALGHRCARARVLSHACILSGSGGQVRA